MPKAQKNPAQKEAKAFLSVRVFSEDRDLSIRFTRKEINERRLGVCRFGSRVLIPAAEAERYDREHFVAPVDAQANARAFFK